MPQAADNLQQAAAAPAIPPGEDGKETIRPPILAEARKGNFGVGVRAKIFFVKGFPGLGSHRRLILTCSSRRPRRPISHAEDGVVSIENAVIVASHNKK